MELVDLEVGVVQVMEHHFINQVILLDTWEVTLWLIQTMGISSQKLR